MRIARVLLPSLALLALTAAPALASSRGNMGRRLEGGIGARFGSFRVNNESTGAITEGHVQGGLRDNRWLVFGEYSLMSIQVSPPTDLIALRGGDAFPVGHGRGLVHRVGAHAKYSYGRVGENDGGLDLYVEGGAGVQHVRWDAGGVWSRPDVSIGTGLAGFGYGKHRHGGLTVGLRVTLARRTDVENAPAACGGPCDGPTTPTGWDRSFMFDLTIMFGT